MTLSPALPPPVVLVVEDEGLVRMLAVDMLEEAGFVVAEAATADEALAILESRSDIAALFTDVDMPGSMNGFALAQRVAERWPAMRVVITSGRFTPGRDDVPEAGLFVPKPYHQAQLLDAVRPVA
jgi:CheY-like chemotaxis protein